MWSLGFGCRRGGGVYIEAVGERWPSDALGFWDDGIFVGTLGNGFQMGRGGSLMGL